MDNIDVELEALLKEDNSKADTASGASDQNSGSDKTSPDEAEMSPRAQERIRELLQENKKLKEQPKPQEQNWIDSIEDEGTRSLLKRTLEEADQRAESKFKPILSQFQDTQFEKTFSQFETAIPERKRS